MSKLGAALVAALLAWGAPCVSAMNIVLTPDAGLAANPAALAAFNRAAAAWSNVFTNDITINISAGLGTCFSNPNIIGHTDPVEFQSPYDFFRGFIVSSAAKDPGDSIVAALPTLAQFKATLPSNITFSGKFYATKANFKALGFGNFVDLDQTYGPSDASITFNSNFPFDYDSSNGVDANKIDFQSVATHEIGHALGFISSVDTVDSLKHAGTGGSLIIAPLDLFRFQDNVAGKDPATEADFTNFPRFLDTGGNAILDDLNLERAMSTGASTGDGLEAAHWKDDALTGHLLGVMDPSMQNGLAESISANDIRALDLIGYDVPEPGSAGLCTLVLAIAASRRKGIPSRTKPVTKFSEPLEYRLLLWGDTGMTNVGETKLPTGVPAQYSAAIDSTTGFGYFGSASLNPALVSKVDLNGPGPSVVQDGLPNTMPGGVGTLLVMLIDTTSANATQHYLYVAGTGGKIIKMSPGDAAHDPQMLATLTPTQATGSILCGAIDSSSSDPTKRYAYFGVNEANDVKVLRIRLSDFTEQGTETLQIGNAQSCGIDTLHHYLYFSGSKNDPQICKVNLSTFGNGGTSTATYDMISAVPGDGIGGSPGFDLTLLIDPIHQFAYLGSRAGVSDPMRSIIVRINLGSGDSFPAHPISTVQLGAGERLLSQGVIDVPNGNVYFATDLTYPAHVYMIHVGDGTGQMSEVGRLDMNLGWATSYPPDGTPLPGNDADQYGEIFFRSAILSASQNAIYFGTDSRPGQIVKVGINGVTVAPTLLSAVSRKPQGNSGTLDLNLTFGAPLSDSPVEPRINGPDQIILNFSENVHAADGNLDGNEFTITNASFSSATVSGSVVTLNLANVVNARYVTVAIIGIVDALDTPLVGQSSGSVGDLCGDANGDHHVNALDFNALASNYGKPGKTFPDGDFTCDGQVNSADFDALAVHFGTNLDGQPASIATSLPVVAGQSIGFQPTPARLFKDKTQIGDFLANEAMNQMMDIAQNRMR